MDKLNEILNKMVGKKFDKDMIKYELVDFADNDINIEERHGDGYEYLISIRNRGLKFGVLLNLSDYTIVDIINFN